MIPGGPFQIFKGAFQQGTAGSLALLFQILQGEESHASPHAPSCNEDSIRGETHGFKVVKGCKNILPLPSAERAWGRRIGVSPTEGEPHGIPLGEGFSTVERAPDIVPETVQIDHGTPG